MRDVMSPAGVKSGVRVRVRAVDDVKKNYLNE